MNKARSVSRLVVLLVLLAVSTIPSASGQESPEARVRRFYITVATGEYSATWEMLSTNLAQETSKEKYTKELAVYFKGSKLNFEVGPVRKRAPESVEVTSDLRVIQENVAYPIRHTTIWVFDKGRNNWFFDGELGRAPVSMSPR